VTTLRVGVAYPDPPFNSMGPDRGGLDIDLITAIGATLGLSVTLVAYQGADFNGIFDELSAGSYDCVIAGTTVTPERERRAGFAASEGKVKAVRVYDYGGIEAALTDLTTGACDAFMKLAPVLTELVKPIPGVEVVQRGLSSEALAIAVRSGDDAMLQRIAKAQAALEDDGTLQAIRRTWLGNPYRDQSVTMH
jgi:polar amino acid transport system substrate-binding protein